MTVPTEATRDEPAAAAAAVAPAEAPSAAATVAPAPSAEPAADTKTHGEAGADGAEASQETEHVSQPQPQPGTAPIKKQYLLPPAAHSPTSEPAARGQHTNRRQHNKNAAQQQPQGSRLCVRVAQGAACPFGDACTFSHDVAAYLAAKPKDLDGTCPLLEAFGRCRFGLRCRFASAHPEPPAAGEAAGGAAESTARAHTLNDFPRDTLIRIRKKQIPCVRSEAFEKAEAAAAASSTSGSGSGTDSSGMRMGDAAHRDKRTRLKAPAIDFAGRSYLAPLTTVGNLPFRRVCKGFGVDITCSEMALAGNLVQGQQHEWALVKRHASETLFGVQLAGGRADVVGRAAELVSSLCAVDFVDINMGCPVDLACRSGGGSALLAQPRKIERMVRMASAASACPVTVKLRTGVACGSSVAHELVPRLGAWGAALATVHGRSRQQRYTRYADWDYVGRCRQAVLSTAGAVQLPVFGGGDVLSWEDYWARLDAAQRVDGVMVGRGALIKPWIFREISERRIWDISAGERLDVLRDFVRFGLEHWGSDAQGVENVRRYLLEWQSFLCRYVPAGILEVLPPRMNDRPPAFCGRSDLETLMASPRAADWVRISEMLLGPAPDGFAFVPKHKSNSYS
ncbi:tRNA-dihydrouridine(47) synthase [NAD(P)(+)]-like protein [Coemansia erecta]|uniref:tRNA-dihydrouridine(47) synthase [NAD(P)(+)] n=1 Tax=Coemansia erecta TaxID=147472 RepID=A0A9W8CQL7_9FUNG|nr:tRNA-dihydrouridine(47) synthase [NAD(P)(+)]-like protein [Coemansia erecta]